MTKPLVLYMHVFGYIKIGRAAVKCSFLAVNDKAKPIGFIMVERVGWLAMEALVNWLASSLGNGSGRCRGLAETSQKSTSIFWVEPGTRNTISSIKNALSMVRRVTVVIVNSYVKLIRVILRASCSLPKIHPARKERQVLSPFSERRHNEQHLHELQLLEQGK